jgi:hypothetical protein
MSLPVIIENDAVRMEVWPILGGKISSILDKSDKFELLFNFPAEIPTASQYDLPYGKGWYAGWDECFPTIAPGAYVGHPYDGIAIPDHGELWGIPTTAVPAKNGITTVWHGLRFGYRLTRKLYIEQADIIAEYTLVNVSPFVFHFVWAAHALMALPTAAAGGVEIELAGAFRASHDADGHHSPSEPFAWPMLQGLDLSRPHALPERQAWKLYSTRSIDAPAIVRYPRRGRGVRMTWKSPDHRPAYWGIWINTGGWAGHHHFAIEPTTGRFDQLARAVRDGSAGKIAAAERLTWSLRWSLF